MPFLRIFLSVALGLALGLASLYVALRVGFNPGVSLLTVLCWSLLNLTFIKLLSRWHGLSQKDLACYQSLTSAMSYAAGTVIATALAAMFLMGVQLNMLQATLWLVLLCVLGTLWTWPFRVRMLAQLPFPSGRAAAETVRKTLDGAASSGFLLWLGLATAWTLLREFWLAKQAWFVQALAQLPLTPSLMLIGLGALLGRSAVDLWVGGLFFFGLPQWGWQAWLSYETGMWLAVGILLGAGLHEPLLALRRNDTQAGDAIDWHQSRRWLAAVIAVSLSLWLCQLWILPQSWLAAGLALLAMPLFSYLACRVTGETDVVPTGGLGKLALLALGLGWPSQVQANMLVTGGLAGTSAASADFMTDLRCGQDLDVAQRQMFRYQLVGAVLGPLLIVPIFFVMIHSGVDLGSADLPAPAAQIWIRFAEINFWDAAFWRAQGRALWLGVLLGGVWALCKRRLRFLPAPMAFATAVFLDLTTVTTLALGALVVRLLRAQQRRDLWSALIAGESLAMIGVLLSL